jgi:hypothetical protein
MSFCAGGEVDRLSVGAKQREECDSDPSGVLNDRAAGAFALKAGARRDLQRSLVAHVRIELKTNEPPVRKTPTGRENERPGCDPAPTMRSSDPITDVGRAREQGNGFMCRRGFAQRACADPFVRRDLDGGDPTTVEGRESREWFADTRVLLRPPQMSRLEWVRAFSGEVVSRSGRLRSRLHTRCRSGRGSG